MRPYIVMLVVFLLSSAALAVGDDENQYECLMFGKDDLLDGNAPTFEQFKVTEEPEFVPAPLNPKSNPIARNYRTAIRSGMKSGPNFAGHYTLVVWGCGTSCSSFAVV